MKGAGQRNGESNWVLCFDWSAGVDVGFGVRRNPGADPLDIYGVFRDPPWSAP